MRLSTLPHVHLRGITWKLTDESQAKLDEESRVEALKNAIARANAYARVIGRENLSGVKISDDVEQRYFVGRTKQTARKAVRSETFGVGVGLDFEPQIMEIEGRVEVEFQAE